MTSVTIIKNQTECNQKLKERKRFLTKKIKNTETLLKRATQMDYLLDQKETERLEELVEKWKDLSLQAIETLLKSQDKITTEIELLTQCGINPALLDFEND